LLCGEEANGAWGRDAADRARDPSPRLDTPATLHDQHSIDIDEAGVNDSQPREMFYRIHSKPVGDEYAENAVSVVFPSLTQTVAVMADSCAPAPQANAAILNRPPVQGPRAGVPNPANAAETVRGWSSATSCPPPEEEATLMISIDRPTIRITSPAEFLALVPYLMGFQPSSSLLVIGIADSQVVMTARMDLPTSPTDLPRLHTALHTLDTCMTTD